MLSQRLLWTSTYANESTIDIFHGSTLLLLGVHVDHWPLDIVLVSLFSIFNDWCHFLNLDPIDLLFYFVQVLVNRP